MPYKTEYQHKKIRQEDKKNWKLSSDDKLKIKRLYETGLYSQRQLAIRYNVSRRLIQYCINPQQYELDRQKFKERQKAGIYYNKEKQREYSKKLRQRRKELNLQNKLV